jgi:glyoxylase-like metal-dependent hydrolase (beta-lactamase superfamily II)
MGTHQQTATTIPIEDEFTDILNKSMRGQRLTAEELADRADLPVEAVQQVREGHYHAADLQRVAYVLNLHGPSLQALAEKTWYPQPVHEMDGFAMFTTPYGDMTVNAFLVWDPQTREAASFDTGATCQPMLDCLKAHDLTLKRIFITHTHPDHLADLDRLQATTEAPGYGSAAENPLGLKPLHHHDGLMVGNLKIRVLGTSGHTPGGLSYFIEGLDKPLVVVGDALFAGSVGGAAYAYEEALANIRTRLLTLPPHTVICPGHGPLTTVGEERAHNPFFPEFK